MRTLYYSLYDVSGSVQDGQLNEMNRMEYADNIHVVSELLQWGADANHRNYVSLSYSVRYDRLYVPLW
jgi:hypothetical protein